jgi:hypothetical protein
LYLQNRLLIIATPASARGHIIFGLPTGGRLLLGAAAASTLSPKRGADSVPFRGPVRSAIKTGKLLNSAAYYCPPNFFASTV